MIVKLLTEHHLDFLSLKGGCRGLSESTIVKMSNCWKSYVTAQLLYNEPPELYGKPFNWYKMEAERADTNKNTAYDPI